MKQSVGELLLIIGGKSQSDSPDTRDYPDSADASRPPVHVSPIKTRNSRAAVVASPRQNGSKPKSRQVEAGVIDWDESSMATGVDSIDSQHQTLIQRINELHQACLAGTAREELLKMLSFLGEYAQSHFKHEEEIMQEHKCPVRGKNKAAHAKFLQDYGTLVEIVKSDGASTTAVIQLKAMLGDWLKNHICSVDTHLRGCPSAHQSQPGTQQPATF